VVFVVCGGVLVVYVVILLFRSGSLLERPNQGRAGIQAK